MPRFRLASLLQGLALLPLSLLFQLDPALCADLPLPTPREHYEGPDPSAESLLRLAASIGELDPSQQLRILGLLQSQGSADGEAPSIDELVAILKSINWEKHRADVLELFLHRSRLLDIIPPASKNWLPIVHDSLLFFLHHLDEKRLVQRLFDQARLPTEAERGQYLLGFLSQTPTLQKIGQILARNPSIPGDLRAALQVLENSLRTTNASDLTRFTLAEIGDEAAKRYQIQFADQILAEATVGAVLRCSLVLPGEEKRTEAVVKIIKPQAVPAMQEELAIFDQLTHYFATHRETYEIGAIPISETFQNVREALSKEIVIVEEQQTLTEIKGKRAFDVLGELMKNLTREGYKIRFNLGLFIKAQITISGILSELDPKLKPDRYLVSQLSNQVLKEMPKRLLYTLWFPAWNSHSYRSMLSNEGKYSVNPSLRRPHQI